ncbi:hypothetical protein [Streptomyces sp. NBC_01794]|uniref:hypothetical protein n=1 Tax=Streptomyces sp. NBC_01794 TaxID=2975942 RepID=UPI003087D74C|nr:hypothetical protein OIE54_11855 [Streptomyces sp. NBC_01794]
MADPTDSAARGEEPRRGRDCAHCPQPGADVCIRVHGSESGGSGFAVYAHRTCAITASDTILYTVVDPTERAS